ncbi:uncharacterized protein LACBIDRAFT_312439 [Laccaria bicolor S238N-H82]|uniref:Predicted protein n=1 Tax=Laccaria bicolor (strain S238N-H82 / ATCC MYA-4686) TaxID=486041 RepID=B0DW60_LACBS|nr:uncharacterized protein LACBIDRAFT_312439 [Laccaria bicolor S238N-H82]EDR01174.1 predicted protein [Laccaria bicolor S238N-H82]|eukprot:XP_001888216.1 predicted protein [Laccaria bicolor S238N-H82]
MTHDETEKRVGEQELAAFQLHEELDERRDRNDGELESEFNLNLYGTSSKLTFRLVINHLAMWIYGQWRRSLPKTRVSHCDLRMICTMPLDILYEIFEHLHPIDLYHISRTNRSFQDILRSPSSSSIWRAAYEKEDEIPRCPEDISELEWADLLFGKRICQQCGNGGAPPNLTFRHRLCRKCARLCLVKQRDLVFPSSSIWSLVRRSQVINMCPDGTFDDDWPLYLKDESKRIDLRLSLTVDFADIKKVVEEHNKKRNLDIDSIRSHVLKTFRWAQRTAQAYQTQREVRYERNMRRVHARLVRSGHTLIDVQKAQFDEDVLDEIKDLKSSLPTRIWDYLKPQLEPAIHLARLTRLEKARKQLIRARISFIKDQYNQYKKDETHPSTWSYHPPLYTVCEFDMLRRLIEREGDELLSADDEGVKDAMRTLPGAVEEWTREKMRQLAGLLPGSRRVGADACDDLTGDAMSIDSPPREPDEPDLHLLNLATSVFTCLGSTISSIRAGRCLIGWDGAGPHLRCGALQTHWDKRLHFSRRGYEAAGALVELVGWDKGTATVGEMDGFDGRFVCGGCTSASAGEGGRKALTWRECVLHYMEKESDLARHSRPSWSLLTDEAKADVVRREEFDPYIKDKSWTCAHCSVHYLAPVDRKGAIDHCKSAHEIRRPIENLDYLYVITTERTPRRPAVFREIADCLCLRCPETGVTRLRTLGALVPHLRDAHQVEAPLVCRDWVQVRTILRSTMDLPQLQRAEGPLR